MFAPRPAPPRPRVPGSLGIALGLPAGGVCAVAACGAPTAGAVLAVLAAAVVGALAHPLPALAAAAQVLACWDGFVLHGFGVLDVEHADLVTLAAVTGTALVVAAGAAMARHRPAFERGYAARSLPVLAAAD